MLRAAVIIPHYNDVDRLQRCLGALWPQLDDTVELVVVDNGSTADLSPLGAFAGLRIVTEPQKGAAAARNRGVSETTAPRLFFLDADCVPSANWLATALAVADRGDVVGGKVGVFDETPPPRSGAEAFETVFAFDNRRYIEEDDFSVTANLLTRRDVFDRVGPFPSGMSEDIEWCRRAVRAGFSLVYVDELSVSHPSRQDWAALRRKWHRLTGELFGLEGTGAAARLKWGLKGLMMPVAGLAQIPRVLRHPALRDGTERRRGVVTLMRGRLLRMGWMVKQALFGRI